MAARPALLIIVSVVIEVGDGVERDVVVILKPEDRGVMVSTLVWYAISPPRD